MTKIRMFVNLRGYRYYGGQAFLAVESRYRDCYGPVPKQPAPRLPRWRRIVKLFKTMRQDGYVRPEDQLFVWREPHHANFEKSPFIRKLQEEGMERARCRRKRQ